MINIDKIMEQKTGGPSTPDKLLELMNRLDLQTSERLETVEGLVDNQGSDLVRCIVYVCAIENLLIDLKLTTKEKFNTYLQNATQKIKDEFATEKSIDTSDISDIKI